LAGVETAAIYSEELQNICIRKQRQKITENGVEPMPRKAIYEQSFGD
jgi:hypothetical protein